MAAPLDGGDVSTLASGQVGPLQIALDETNLYWSNYSSGEIMMLELTGGVPRVLAAGQSCPGGIALDDTNVYWANYCSSGAGIMKLKIR